VTYNDSNIRYGSNRELVFHITISGGVVALILGAMLFVVPLKTMPTTDIEIVEFPELMELRAAEATALSTTTDNGDGTHVIPIEAAMAARVAEPDLLSHAFDGMGSDGSTDGLPVDPLVTTGKALFGSKICFTCHSIDGSRLVGPSFKGLMGREEKLADGSTITVDVAYITESIRDPMAKIVEGYAPAMPVLDLSDDEISALIAYISSLE
jgi:mono/diheme cytochrome c family protein